LKAYKKFLIDFVERRFNCRVVHPDNVGSVFEEEHLKKFLQDFEVDCVFDVGANEGQYARRLRDKCGFAGKIISFEPSPAVAQILKTNAASDPNWFVEPVGLDSEVRELTFNVMAGSQFSSFHEASNNLDLVIFENKTKIREAIKVKTSTVDLAIEKYASLFEIKRPFLKMDTQGHDVAVISGAGKYLDHFVGLQSELAIKAIYKGSPSFDQTISIYRKKGFDLSAFVPNNFGHFPQLIEIDCIMYRPNKVIDTEPLARRH
jgi:FkbM family methyltransferase